MSIWPGSRNKRSRSTAANRRSNPVIDYLVSLLCTSSNPKDVVREYLLRPVRRARFSQLVAQIAEGNVSLSSRPPVVSFEEIRNRAAALLNWLDGKDAAAKSPHDVLGLNHSASAKEIQQRYRRLSKRTHPDLHPASTKDYWLARQREVNEAYRALTDPDARAGWQARMEERNQLLRRLWEIESQRGR